MAMDRFCGLGLLGGVPLSNEFPGGDFFTKILYPNIRTLFSGLKDPHVSLYNISLCVFRAAQPHFTGDFGFLECLASAVLNQEWDEENELLQSIRKALAEGHPLPCPDDPGAQFDQECDEQPDTQFDTQSDRFLDCLKRLVRDRWKYPLMERRVILALHRFYLQHVQPQVVENLVAHELISSETDPNVSGPDELLLQLRPVNKHRLLTTRPENKDLFVFSLEQRQEEEEGQCNGGLLRCTSGKYLQRWEEDVNGRTESCRNALQRVRDEFDAAQERGEYYDYEFEYMKLCGEASNDRVWLRVGFYLFYLQTLQYLLDLTPMYIGGTVAADDIATYPELARCFSLPRQLKKADVYDVIIPPCFASRDLLNHGFSFDGEDLSPDRRGELLRLPFQLSGVVRKRITR